MVVMRIVDMNGVERDWAWVQATYGPVAIEDPAVHPAVYFQVVQLVEIEGPMAATCTLLDDVGAPIAGGRVVYSWPGGPSLPDSGWDRKGVVHVTNGFGVAEHSMGQGEGYAPPTKGPISWYVYGEGESQRISGLGWLAFTNHRHLQTTMRLVVEEPPEPPEPPDDGDENWDMLFEKLDLIIELLECR